MRSGSGLTDDADSPVLRWFVPSLLVWLGVVQGIHRAVRLSRGSVGLHPDVTSAWRPVARAVAAGTPLYTAGAADNKPPLFELLNLAVYATDHYAVAFLLLVGLANGVVAALVWWNCRLRGAGRVGLVAGVLYLGALPAVNGTAINVRSFAMVGALAALALGRPTARGLALAAGALCSQYAVFALPAVVYDGWRGRVARRWGTGAFARLAAGLFTGGGAGYGLVLAGWGPAAAASGLRASVGRAPEYVFSAGPSALTLTATWSWLLVETHVRLLGLLWFGLVGLVPAVGSLRRGERGCGPLAVLLAVPLGLPLLVRPFQTYWLYPLPGIAILAALGLRWLLGR